MSDLFHEEVPDAFIVDVARVMARAGWHTFQVLTKRSERMRDLLAGPLAFAARLPHVWWGVSVENRRHGLPRIEHLRGAGRSVYPAWTERPGQRYRRPAHDWGPTRTTPPRRLLFGPRAVAKGRSIR
jgi:hypothetical protein